LIVDKEGVPLAVELSPANLHDSMMLVPMLDKVRPIASYRGRPRKRPHRLHADKAYDHYRCRLACRLRHVVDRIARRGVESGEHFGRHRWVVERTFAWLRRFRRLTIRYERRADIHRAFLNVAISLICLKFITRWF
jgi:transposase